MSRVGHLYLVDLAQKETGVSESDIGALHGRGLERLAGFCRRESVNAVGVPIDDRRISLGTEFRAEFVAVVVFDPTEERVECRRLRYLISPSLRTDWLPSALAVTSKKTTNRRRE